jgi:hypothetical protein
MNNEDSFKILNGFAEMFATVGFLNYEMISPDD